MKKNIREVFHVFLMGYLTPGEFMKQYEMIITPLEGIFTLVNN